MKQKLLECHARFPNIPLVIEKETTLLILCRDLKNRWFRAIWFTQSELIHWQEREFL